MILKLQYDINREAPKISASLSGKIDKYEYLAGEQILPSDKSRIIQQAKFTNSPPDKAFEKKTIEEQGEKQVKVLNYLKPEKNQELESIEGLFQKTIRNDEIKNEIDEIKKWEEKTI